MRFLLKLKLLVLLLFSFNFTYSQNLIANPSFEFFNHSILSPQTFPPVYTHFECGYGGNNWQQRNSIDFFYAGTATGPPGYNHARTGKGWVQFAATAFNNNPSNPYREYVIQSLTLIANTKYKVEFWVKRDAGVTDIKIGGYLTTTNITGAAGCSGVGNSWLQIANTHVSAVIAGNNYQYTKVLGFFTPTTSGTYYLTIGNFTLTATEGYELNGFFLDDVSVTPCTGLGATNPQVTLNKNAFCPNQPIIADGSNSTNVDCYKWELVNTTSSITKSTGFLTGTPSANFSVIGTFGSLTKGNCYRLKLITIEDCDQDEAFQDFCIEDPNVQLSLTGTNPYCEGDNVTITATGDNGWTYVWSNGQSGVGLKNINITTNTNTSQYTVTVTTSAGCTATQSVNLTVHSSNNVAPTTGGINNTGDFTYYINAPKFPTNNSFSFYIPTYDSPNEEVSITSWSSLPPNSTFVPNGATQEVGLYDWLNPGPNIPDIGVHFYYKCC
jgi:hypothetical protein